MSSSLSYTIHKMIDDTYQINSFDPLKMANSFSLPVNIRDFQEVLNHIHSVTELVLRWKISVHTLFYLR